MTPVADPNWLSFVGSLYAAIGVLIFAMGTRSSLMSVKAGSTRSDGGTGVLFGGLVAAAGLLLQGFGQVHVMGRGGALALLVLIAGLLPLFYMMFSDWIEMNDMDRSSSAATERSAGANVRTIAPAEQRRLEVVHDTAERALG
jgi:hypothetical protein